MSEPAVKELGALAISDDGEVEALREEIEVLKKKNTLAASAVLDLSQRLLTASDEGKEKDKKLVELEDTCKQLSSGFVALKENFEEQEGKLYDAMQLVVTKDRQLQLIEEKAKMIEYMEKKLVSMAQEITNLQKEKEHLVDQSCELSSELDAAHRAKRAKDVEITNLTEMNEALKQKSKSLAAALKQNVALKGVST